MDYLLHELPKSQGALHIVKQISRQCDAQAGLLEHYGNEYFLAKAIVELSDRITKLGTKSWMKTYPVPLMNNNTLKN